MKQQSPASFMKLDINVEKMTAYIRGEIELLSKNTHKVNLISTQVTIGTFNGLQVQLKVTRDVNDFDDFEGDDFTFIKKQTKAM